jgi:glycosyltransferase involved in cell wall biosynthesis
MITYNHERFIDQAITSVLEQQTSFPIELVIGEDCSTDGTRARVVAWAARCPDIIRPLLHRRNMGPGSNYDAVLRACRGEYVANLEGDDYWTDPSKLQQQVDCLDHHPGASLCFHKVAEYDDQLGTVKRITPLEEQYRRSGLSAEEMLHHHVTQSNSKVWRRKFLPHFRHVRGVRQLDRALDVILALQGEVLFIDKVMSVYRLHAGGIWVGATKLNQDIGLYQCLKLLYGNVPRSFRPRMVGSLIGAHMEVIAGLRRARDPRLILSTATFLFNLTRLPRGEHRRYLGWLMHALAGGG